MSQVNKTPKAPLGAYRGLSLIALLACCLQPSAHAVDLDATIQATVMATDNVARQGTGELDEIISTVGLQFQVLEASPRLVATIVGDLSYQDYNEGTFDGETINYLDASASYALIPGRFIWRFENTSGQQVVNPLQPSNPGNRQDTNVFSTGPDVILPLGIDRTEIHFTARYQNTGFEVANADNDRFGLQSAIERRMSRNSLLALVFSNSEIKFDSDASGQDFRRDELVLSYQLNSDRTELAIEAGVNKLKLDGETSTEGEEFSINLQRLLTPSSTLVFAAGRTLSDTGDLFRLFQGNAQGIDPTADFQASGDPFVSDFFNVSYAIAKPRTDFQISASLSGEDYETQTLQNRDRFSLNIDISRQISRTFNADIELGYTERDFTELDRVDEDRFASLELSRDFGRVVTAGLGVRYFDRDSTQVGVAANETQYFFRISYGFFGRREFRAPGN